MRKRKWVIHSIWVSFLILFLGWIFYSYHHAASGGAKLHKVMRSDISENITISGTVVPERQTLITAAYAGYVEKLYVTVGQKVRKGDPIVSIVQSLQLREPVHPMLAPYDGTVSLVRKAEGEFVKQSDPNDFIVEIDDLSQMYVTADVPEMNAPKIKVGQKALIKITSLLQKNYHGEVQTVSLAAKSSPNVFGRNQVTYPVRVVVTGSDRSLKSGMSAILDIVSQEKKNVLTLSHEFIQRKEGKYFVILKNGQERLITIGLENAEEAEVTKGLKEGDEVRAVDYTQVVTPEGG